tara:strand:- start:51 stop:161 length:111 start_codon:yes stop_codon:yes gene_type:complete
MKKELIIVGILMISILSVSFVSAGLLGDFFGYFFFF